MRAVDLEGVQCEFGLVERVLGPGTTTSYIRGAVVKHNFSLIVLKDEAIAEQITQAPSAVSLLASELGGTCPEEETGGLRGRMGTLQRGMFQARHRGDVFCEGDAVVDGLDVHNVNADDG